MFLLRQEGVIYLLFFYLLFFLILFFFRLNFCLKTSDLGRSPSLSEELVKFMLCPSILSIASKSPQSCLLNHLN